MKGTLEDFVIPAGHGRAFVVPRGAVLRIHLVEDKQVGDCCFFNAQDRLHERRHAARRLVLAAVSACPADRNATNDRRAKPLGIKIFG